MKATRSTKERKNSRGCPPPLEPRKKWETLDLILKDPILGLKVILSYSIFEKEDIIARSARLINEGSETLKVEKVYSAAWIWTTKISRC